MKTPVSAHCAHVFCRFCILKLLEQKKGIAKCPLCNGNISKSTLQEDVRFKLVIEAVLEAIGALECDTGFSCDQGLHKKAVETTSAAVLQEKQTIVESKGYRDRRNGVKKAEKRNSTLQGKSSHLPLPNRTVTRCSLTKKSHSNKTVCFEIASDSSEDFFQKTGTVRRVGLRTSSRSQDGERRAQKRSRSPSHVELQQPNGEDVFLLGTPEASGLSNAGPGSTEGTGASPESRQAATERVAAEKRHDLSSPVPCMRRRRGHLVSGSTEEGGSYSLPGMKRSEPVGEATDPAPNKQAGNKVETIVLGQPAGRAQVDDLVCEDKQVLQQPPAAPGRPFSPVSGEALIQSIQKVHEWFSRSKNLPPALLQDVDAAEGDPDLNPDSSDSDSHVFQKTEPRKGQWEVAAGRKAGSPLSKPLASRMVDKIFGRRYMRTRKPKPLGNEKETIVPAEESCTVVNTQSCDSPVRRIPAQRKATLELTPEDVMKKQTAMEDSEGAGGDAHAVLEEDGHGLAVVEGAVQRSAELPAKDGASAFELDASPVCCQSLKKTGDSLSQRSWQPGRPVCALQLTVQGGSASPEKTKAQEDGHPSCEEPREASTDETPVRRSKRLLSRAAGEQRGIEPAKKRRKPLLAGERKRKETPARNASPSIAEGSPGMLQDVPTSMAGDTGKAAGAFPGGEGSPSAEPPAERDSSCRPVPDATSQGSVLLLQCYLAEGGQSDLNSKAFTAVPQAEQRATCTQSSEGNRFCGWGAKESCKSPRAGSRALGNGEFNLETDDSELDPGFMGKIFRRCKRQSFLLHPAPPEKPAAGTQMELSIGQVEGSKAEWVEKSVPGIAGVSEERRDSVASRVANSTASPSLVSHPPHSCDQGSEHLQVASQALFPNSSCMPVAAEEAQSGNLLSQKPASDKKESSNAGDCSTGSPCLWRSSNFQGTSLPFADETSSNPAQFLETRLESDRNRTLPCSFCSELIQPLPVARHLWPSEFSSGSVEDKHGAGEQKQLKSPGEETVQLLSTGVSEVHSERSPEDEISGVSWFSDTPGSLLGPTTESTGCLLNPQEGDQQGALTVFAKTDPGSHLEKDPECSSSRSRSRPEALPQARRRRAQKLPSSSEDDSSEDEELPCFQALALGRSAGTPSQPAKEEEALAEILAQRSSSQRSPKSQRGSPSQESEGSMNLFSSQSWACEDSPSKPCETRPLTPVPTSKAKGMTPRTATEPLSEICREAGQLPDGHQDCINTEPNLGEAVSFDSEVSHLGDSSGFSSQSEILTPQQKDAMQKNLKKLQQEMAVLEAALKEGGQDASAEGLLLPGEENVFAGVQTGSARGVVLKASSEDQRTSHGNFSSSDGLPSTPQGPVNTEALGPGLQQGHEPGSTSKLRCGSQQSLPPAGSPHWTPDSHSTSSSASQEHTSCCLATEPERGSPVAIRVRSGAPEHESQGTPISPFAATTICSGRKGNSKSLLLTSKRSMSLVTSGLFLDELRLVQKFARKTKSTWSNTVSDETTHVIMKTDEDLVCERTLKYFLGIAAQKWVVSYQWVLQSLKEGRVLNEGDFEVRGDIINGRNHQGPKRARESSTGKLFQGLEICCYGPFTDMQREQLEWMVELCGASLVKQPHLFSCPADSGQAMVVIQPDAWVEDSGCPGIPSPCSAAVVAREWVLDSVASYQRVALDEYIVQRA